ncbi:FAD-dependent oxidoreductase [Marinilongibacter aquaticus]|uniref:FAD-dependent oxidoreductase n=1 Tax=Marinilongibacter aquaticus TaxID=2975157 RepID=UPI0021BD5FEB|nr:FAD-dependent oxidoreductase [Marinilongibacter aquaticus]UBM59069.1 FAD-dependent oxidoreductase [Marinilongibacter aquaticus]
MINLKQLFLCAALALSVFVTGCKSSDSPETIEADAIVYGGTSAAITAAVQLARLGKSVVIVCPEKHLGGMTTGGLGWTDSGNKQVIGGLSREFYQRVYAHYESDSAWKWQSKDQYGNKGQGTAAMDGDKRTMWIFEPHVAEQVYEDFITENNIQVYRNHWLNRQSGVETKDGKIVSFTTLDGKKFKGKMFIDVTYEGDLMAAANVSYHVGREANSVYGEEWNGIQVGVLHHGHHFGDRHISPYVEPGNPESGVLPRISTEDPGQRGDGDKRIQAYCFRMCLTQVPENKIDFEKPEGYDSTQYELLVRVLDDGWRETFNKFDPIPNFKTDVNNHGPFSFDNIGMNYDYPEASYERRKEIIAEHETYQRGLLYFYCTDPRIPKEVQDEMRKWGLAKDEFADNGHWPYQIYVREGRRMIGDFVMTEHEVQGTKPVLRPIGMGSYTMDSHNAQRYITPEGFVQNEGDIGVHPKQPYQIDMGSIMPKESECTNLLVPVAVSSSHIAFGSIRMEPVFMILGQSAGLMASLAMDKSEAVQDLAYSELEPALLKAGQVLTNPKEQ